jgi:polyhydroxyalkanoate synthase
VSEHRSHFNPHVVGRRGKLSLLAFVPERRRFARPVVLVPALIGRPTLFDLGPDASFVGALLARGFAVYLVDWGRYGYEDRDLGLDDVVLRLLAFVLDRVRAREGRRPVSVVGYCMGGTLATIAATVGVVRPDDRLVTLAAPIAFGAAGGKLARWCAPDVLDLDRTLQLFGNLPAHMIEAAFLLLRPTARLRALLAHEPHADRAAAHAAIARWSSTWLDLPGAFARQWIGELYREDRLVRGRLRLAGRHAQLTAIRSPLLVLAADDDAIAPRASCEPLAALVASPDTTFASVPGGHIALVAGRGAQATTYPLVEEWLAARSC